MEYYDIFSGVYYRNIEKHYSDYSAEYSNEIDENGPLNWKPCFLTKIEVKRITGGDIE